MKSIDIGGTIYALDHITHLRAIQEVKVSRPRPKEGVTPIPDKVVYKFIFGSNGQLHNSPDYDTSEEAETVWTTIAGHWR